VTDVSLKLPKQQVTKRYTASNEWIIVLDINQLARIIKRRVLKRDKKLNLKLRV
jgi:hypothetical protein